MGNLIFFLSIIVAVAIIIWSRAVQTEAAHFAVATIFGRAVQRVLAVRFSSHFPWVKISIQRVLSPGLSLIPPLATVRPEHVYSEKPFTLSIGFSLTTADNREIKLEGTLRCAWNPRLMDNQSGNPRVLSVTPELIQVGLSDKLKSEIGRFGGTLRWIVFRSKRRAIEYYINSILRLERPPHVDPKEILTEQLGESQYDHLNSKLGNFESTDDSPEVPLEKRLQFYEAFSGPIGDLLRTTPDDESDSHEEKYYAIAIHEFTMGDVDFDKATRETMEQAERAKDEVQGAKIRHKMKREWAKELREEDELDPQSAQDSAELNMGQAEKKIHSVTGLKGLFGGG